MLLGRVTGTVTATAKDPALQGGAYLLVDPSSGSGELVALDTVGAGIGDTVLISTGSAARLPAQATGTPVDASIIAIVDDVARTEGSKE